MPTTPPLPDQVAAAASAAAADASADAAAASAASAAGAAASAVATHVDELQAIVAASTDFANFKTRIAAWSAV